MDCRGRGKRSGRRTGSAPGDESYAGNDADENPGHKCRGNPEADDAYSAGDTPDQIPASHKECREQYCGHEGKTHGQQRTESAAEGLRLNAADESPEEPKPIHLRPQEKQQERDSNGEPQDAESVQMGYLGDFILSSGGRKAGERRRIMCLQFHGHKTMLLSL